MGHDNAMAAIMPGMTSRRPCEAGLSPVTRADRLRGTRSAQTAQHLLARALLCLSFARALPNLGVRRRRPACHGVTTELAMADHFGLWSGRKYFLNKMTLRELIVAYFTHHSILTYLVLIAGSIWLAVAHAAGSWGPLGAAAVIALIYPLVEYLMHRYVLHSRFLYRYQMTAALWKRIHYDHHQNPSDLSVLFGALYTTLPTIFVIASPVGWLIAGLPGAAAAFATALILFSLYEFCHCIQHLPFMPRWHWLRELKRHHLAHHFHSEQGNFGITSFIWDRIFGTLYQRPQEVGKSPTVHNLGYTGREREAFPWVAELSADDDAYAAARRRRAS
jgi:sterol desaturase/sphingolipid hydroxylase (fatty acid hydroxylase superfamily)